MCASVCALVKMSALFQMNVSLSRCKHTSTQIPFQVSIVFLHFRYLSGCLLTLSFLLSLTISHSATAAPSISNLVFVCFFVSLFSPFVSLLSVPLCHLCCVSVSGVRSAFLPLFFFNACHCKIYGNFV